MHYCSGSKCEYTSNHQRTFKMKIQCPRRSIESDSLKMRSGDLLCKISQIDYARFTSTSIQASDIVRRMMLPVRMQ